MADLYFLGGQDLEMTEIRHLLEQHAPGRYCDKRLAWGAKFSDYTDDIAATLDAGDTPVFIELIDDLPPEAFDRARAAVIDHHGPLAGHDRPTSIEQLFARLGLPQTQWTPRLALIAANDRGHIAAMKEMGASTAEMAAIREEDRAAQGVTVEDEVEAERAIAARRSEGRLTIVETVSRTSSAIADQMHVDLGGPGYERLIVVMPGKFAAFGDGAMITALAAAFPGSYWGGDLPRAGFWGMDLPQDSLHDEVLARIETIVRA